MVKTLIIQSVNGFGITWTDKTVRKNLKEKERLATLPFELMQMGIT